MISTYNPVYDLVSGLFLIAVPIMVFLWLGISLVIANSKSKGHSFTFGEWLEQIIQEATGWKEHFDQTDADKSETPLLTPAEEEQLGEAIKALQNLKPTQSIRAESTSQPISE